jgi:hypothetical protein
MLKIGSEMRHNPIEVMRRAIGLFVLRMLGVNIPQRP